MGYIEPICKQFYWRCKYNEKIFFPIFRYVEIFHFKTARRRQLPPEISFLIRDT